jgi:hypothetical protein
MVMNLTEKEINQRYQEDIFRHFEQEVVISTNQ